MSQPVNWIVDLDLAQFFDTMPHLEIHTATAADQGQEISAIGSANAESRVQTPGGLCGELGSPQGSIVSPVLANIFLDQVLDQWFMTVVRQHCRGYCALIRYADVYAVFEFEDDARRFCESCRNDWRNSDRASTKPKPNCCRLSAKLGRHSRVGSAFPPLIFSASPIIGRRKSSIEAKTTKKRFRRARPSISGCARNATLVSYLRSGKPSGKVADISTTLGSPTTVVRYTALNGRYTLCS